jgi:hypothetical protein
MYTSYTKFMRNLYERAEGDLEEAIKAVAQTNMQRKIF